MSTAELLAAAALADIVRAQYLVNELWHLSIRTSYCVSTTEMLATASLVDIVCTWYLVGELWVTVDSEHRTM